MSEDVSQTKSTPQTGDVLQSKKAAQLRAEPQGTSKDAAPLKYVRYDIQKEHVYLTPIRRLISNGLSEPYSIYVYRYFLNQWEDLCFMVSDCPNSTNKALTNT